MESSNERSPLTETIDRRDRHQPHIVIGVTSAQTCLILRDRLTALREAGFRVTLIASPGSLMFELALHEGVEPVAVPMARAISPVRDAISLLRLWRVLRSARPDVVEFSTPKAGLLGMLAAVAAGVPKRVYLLRGLRLETASGIKKTILGLAERISAACAQTVLCTSASLRAQALALRIAPAEKLRVLGTGSSIGVDTERFAPGPGTMRPKLGIPHSAEVIGFTGRLTRDKGLPELIEAFERIVTLRRRAYLLLVGWFDEAEDAVSPALREVIARHPRIVCTGFVADAAPYYRAMDVFALPTLREGFPNAVLEASATGLPVVTTLSTGARDAVVPEVTGFLVPPQNAEALEEALVRLLSGKELRDRMGRAGRAWVKANFSQNAVLEENAAFFHGLIASSDAVRKPPRCEDAVAHAIGWRARRL